MENSKIILKASAGTGKTYRLSLEYIKSLINGENYNEIVVMTFTKKATAEIKERIFDFIYQISFEKGNFKELSNSLYELYGIENINKEKLQKIYFEMLKNKENIRIYTIDKFTNKIFKMAIAPTLSVYNYEVLDQEDEKFYGEIFEEIIRNDELFNKFKFLIEEKNDKKNIETYIELIKDILRLENKYLLGKNCEKVVQKPVSIDFVNCLGNAFEVLAKAVAKKGKGGEPLENYTLKLFVDTLLNFMEIDGKYPAGSRENKEKKLEYVLENWEIYFSKLDEDKTLKIWNGVKLRNSKACDLTNEFDDMREYYQSFLKGLSKYIFNEKIIPLNEKIEIFAKDLFGIVEKIKIKRKKFTHEDISTYTYKFIFDKKLKFIVDGTVTDDFFDLIGGKVKTIMIDEFQDTSILQWKILKLIIGNAENVICVGDEKQSIYSWRGGEKELFEKLDKIVGGKVENLKKSFRSYKEIIENVNKIYENYRRDWDYERVSYREDEEYQGGYFSYDISEITKDEDEIRGYENIIDNIKNGKVQNLGKSCIICRTNNQLNEIVKRLNEEEIPYTLTSNASLLEHSGVKPIYRLMKFYLYENMQYLLEFIRSDLIGGLNSHVKYLLENKREILRFISFSKDNFEKFVGESQERESLLEYENIRKMERNNLDFVKVLENIRDLKVLSEDLNGKNRKENFSKEIIERFSLLNYYSTNSDVKNIYNFFSQLKSYRDLFEFINDMEEKKDKITQISSSDVDAINLMTVHKSKGLEFDTIFYYKRDRKQSGDKSNLTTYMKFDEKYENVLNFLVVLKKYKKALIDGEFYDLEEENNLREEIEEINNDYVALTRAKKNLMLMFDVRIDKETGKYNNKLANRLLEIYNDLRVGNSFFVGEVTESKRENIEENTVDIKPLMKYFEDNVEKEWQSNSKLDLEGEFKRKKGLAMHYYFEHILNDVERDRKTARSVYFNKYGNMLGKETLIELLNKMENFVEKNIHLYDKKYKVFTEFEIFDSDGQRKIIDRLNIDEENRKIYIYDYKTGDNPEEKRVYEEQLENYKKIIEEKIGENYEVFTKILVVD